jgi:hypothetical protein
MVGRQPIGAFGLKIIGPARPLRRLGDPVEREIAEEIGVVIQ